jgi:hypothetical protein
MPARAVIETHGNYKIVVQYRTDDNPLFFVYKGTSLQMGEYPTLGGAREAVKRYQQVDKDRQAARWAKSPIC